MTEKLRTLMAEQADSVDFAMPDLDALTRDGDRRVRRRRGLAVVGGVAATAVLGGLVATQLGGDDRATDRDVAAAPAAAPLSWVDGSTLHVGDQLVELDFRPRAYVRTAAGYVLSDREGRVWSWADGEMKDVGSTDATRPHLVADAESDLAGWFDPDQGSYAVLDQRPNGSVVYHRAPAGSEPEDFVAMDAGTAYWTDDAGLVGFDLETGRTTSVPVDRTVADIEDALVAVRTDAGLSVRTLAGEEVRLLDGFYGELGSFSPDARYVTNDADEPQVFDLEARERVALDTGGRAFATGYEWLGPRTLAVIAAAEAEDSSVAELLECDVVTGACKQVTELGTFDEVAATLVLPTGSPIDN